MNCVNNYLFAQVVQQNLLQSEDGMQRLKAIKFELIPAGHP